MITVVSVLRLTASSVCRLQILCGILVSEIRIIRMKSRGENATIVWRSITGIEAVAIRGQISASTTRIAVMPTSTVAKNGANAFNGYCLKEFRDSIEYFINF